MFGVEFLLASSFLYLGEKALSGFMLARIASKFLIEAGCMFAALLFMPLG